ncbi:MAG TPA: addiction module protein [Tepidisphaeraceae bacterium]|nr:addiction module protein [Tepidisphaeraceae bacterium]
MAMTKRQIIEAAKGLKLDDRMDVVDELVASVTPDEQREIDKAWEEEAEARLDAFERGEIKDVPGEQALDEIEAKYRK